MTWKAQARGIGFLFLVICVSSCAFGQAPTAPRVIAVSGDTEYAHDPSIIKDGDMWYLFGTANGPHRNGELPIRCSPDLQQLKLCGHGDYFYLFVSFDLCCRRTKSNYKTMVGRSHDVTGPYLDATRTPMMEGGGTPVLLGNDRWIGPGGESVRQGKDQDIMVFHAYDGKTGDAYLQLSTINSMGGWPHVALEGGNPANK